MVGLAIRTLNNNKINRTMLRSLLLSCFLLITTLSYSQLSLTNGTTTYTVDFDGSQTGVNQGAFNGTGLNNPPSTGQLDGNAWAFSGMSTGNHNFGDISIANDYARGSSAGGVGTGGLYSFSVGSNNNALGIQPTGTDWTPGAMCLKIVNNQSSTIQDMDISYIVYIRNDQDRANSFKFSFSTDNVNFTSVPSADVISPAGKAGSPAWDATPINITLGNLELNPGQSMLLKWDGSDQGGSGSRDEFALDDITIVASAPNNNCVQPSQQPSNLVFSTVTDNSIAASFTQSSADKFLVIQSTSSSFSGSITDGATYSVGSNVGNGVVVQYSNSASFISSNLQSNTTYYYYIFAANDNCLGGPDYLSTDPLTGNTTTSSDPNSDYYSVVNGQTCADLKTVLHNLIKGHTQYSYNSLWSVYQQTDDRINDSGNETIVWDMYSDNPAAGENEFTFVAEQCGSYQTEGDCYNREHSFPKSWWGGSTSATQHNDIFVVVPVDGWINGLRNNNPYGVVQTGGAIQTTNNGSKLGSSAIPIPGYTGNVFEPIDAYKGDLARGYFYMLTRYENEIAGWENFTVESDAVLDGNSYPGMEQWAIDMLIDWHTNDPVSQKEIDRNNEVFNYQQNRNPFIDHPEYVAMIWQGCSGGGDTEAPTAPNNLLASNTSASSTDLSWDLSNDNIGVTGYNVYQDGTIVTTSATTTITITGLAELTSYTFQVTAYDAAGNESTFSNNATATTGTGADTQAPTVPTSLSASNVTVTTADLSWNASNDNVGVTGYNIYQNGSIVSSTAGTTTTISGLTASTTYLFNVSAYDAAGNESATSSTISITTDTPADNQAPTVPTSLSVANVTDISADLSWNASNDNVGVTGYNIYQDGIVISSTSSTSFVVTGLTAGSTYLFNVSAFDAAGNESATSSTISVTTSGGAGGPTILHEGYFESGWDNWQDGGSDASRYSGTRSSEGSFSIRLRDNSGTSSSMTSESFDLTSFTEVKVDFSYYVHSFENVENFLLRYYDGNSWVTVKDYIRGTDFNNSTFYTTSVTLSSSDYTFASNSSFRFQADASGNNDQVYIDAVIITGDPSNNNSLIAKDTKEVAALMEVETADEIDTKISTIGATKAEIKIYPNPASDYLNIDLMDRVSEITKIEIYNSMGQRVQTINSIESSMIRFDITNLENGIYFVRFESTQENMESKIFIKN